MNANYFMMDHVQTKQKELGASWIEYRGEINPQFLLD